MTHQRMSLLDSGFHRSDGFLRSHEAKRTQFLEPLSIGIGKQNSLVDMAYLNEKKAAPKRHG